MHLTYLKDAIKKRNIARCSQPGASIIAILKGEALKSHIDPIFRKWIKPDENVVRTASESAVVFRASTVSALVDGIGARLERGIAVYKA